MKFSDMLDKQPKIKMVSNKDMYITGLKLLSVMADELIDIDPLSNSRFEKEGYFYEIPYLHSDILYSANNKVDILIVYHITKTSNGHMSSECPFRIEFVYDENEMTVVIHNQVIQERQLSKRTLIYKKTGGLSETGFTDIKSLRLSHIIADWDVQKPYIHG